jgi:hypothetical protein
MRPIGARAILLASAAYIVIGMGTAALARDASSVAGVKGWRLAAWLLSVGVFASHIAVLYRHHRSRPVFSASQVGVAVALGALGLAVLGPVRSHWSEPARIHMMALAVIAWPVLTGLPAFCVAVVVNYVMMRTKRHSPSRP